MSAAPQPAALPPRADWPDPPPRSEPADLLTEIVVTTLRLNGRLMETAQDLASAGGLTAAWWQVLGGVLDQPRTVADVGRLMGLTRQGVQRTADLLVERGLAEYRDNPAHRRAKLLACTEAGYWGIRQISLVQRPWADRIAGQLDIEELRSTLETMRRLVGALEADRPRQ